MKKCCLRCECIESEKFDIRYNTEKSKTISIKLWRAKYCTRNAIYFTINRYKIQTNNVNYENLEKMINVLYIKHTERMCVCVCKYVIINEKNAPAVSQEISTYSSDLCAYEITSCKFIKHNNIEMPTIESLFG